MTVAAVTRELARQHVSYELIQHRRTRTAREEASLVGVPARDVAKTIVLAAGDGGFVRAVLPASEKLDLAKVREVVGGGKHLRLATEAELVGLYPMFELGAVPPFGGPETDRVVVDLGLARLDYVVLEAGSHSESVRIRVADLLQLTGAQTADLCRDER